tara:strand:- start:18127 stop:19050 length:924 start_codon:yes stop_codon:yes gene_type:complete
MIKNIKNSTQQDTAEMYRVGRLGLTNDINSEGEPKTLEDAVKEACIDSAKTSYTATISKNSPCINDSEIVFLVVDGKLFKHIDTNEVVDELCVKIDDQAVLGREPKIETASKLIRANMVDEFKDYIVYLSDINECNKQGNTLAMVAAWNGNIPLLKLIYENGGDFNAPNVSLFGSRHLCVLKYLKHINKLNVNAKDDNGFTPLQQLTNISVAFGGHDLCLVPGRIECMKFLINEEADINAQNKFGRTAFHALAYQPSIDFLNAFLLSKPDPTIVCADGKTPIMYSYDSNIELRIREYCFEMNGTNKS